MGGALRLRSEFASGVELMQKGVMDVKPLITQTVTMADAEVAFQLASDRSRAMKAQILFSEG